ncbi:hypothetical protein BCR44DRAFT_1206217 [Catenaria anguillulae PL171]|uniref:Uncharacterized protein n=1 Tax=Catenaria anguillulae PL171 TaxID=765915 RepID=A0A1Y2HHB6_9FUNG|nr:hypothetical protein BCR44DRAFT_1206217 [Catenaria anguillulae PL171]
MMLSSMPSLDEIRHHNPAIRDSMLSMHAMPWGVSDAVYGVLDEALVDQVDVVLAADCLFHHDVYDRVFATFSLIASFGAGHDGRAPPVLVVGYQRRSSSHSIVPLLKQWDLKVTHAIKATQLAEFFVNRDHQASAEDLWSEAYGHDPSWNMSGFDSVDVLLIQPH